MNKILSIILGVLIIVTVGTIIYLVNTHAYSKNFTEFYILGVSGKTSDYPTDFTIQEGNVVSVQYGKKSQPLAGNYGTVTLGIVNQEHKDTSYTIRVTINDEPKAVLYEGKNVKEIGTIFLTAGKKWEQRIGIIPEHTGTNQKIEISLFKDNGIEPYVSLHLWINVK